MKQDWNAEFAESLGQPLAVCVQALSAGQLVADGNNFRNHSESRWQRCFFTWPRSYCGVFARRRQSAFLDRSSQPQKNKDVALTLRRALREGWRFSRLWRPRD